MKQWINCKNKISSDLPNELASPISLLPRVGRYTSSDYDIHPFTKFTLFKD